MKTLTIILVSFYSLMAFAECDFRFEQVLMPKYKNSQYRGVFYGKNGAQFSSSIIPLNEKVKNQLSEAVKTQSTVCLKGTRLTSGTRTYFIYDVE